MFNLSELQEWMAQHNAEARASCTNLNVTKGHLNFTDWWFKCPFVFTGFGMH